MKSRADKRSYRMGARADAAAATAQRITDAALRQFADRPYDDVSLASVADEAGVTVQTVLRRFGSKEGLVEAAARAGTESVRLAREAVPVGDLDVAIRNLIEHYELWGDRVIRLLAQEDRVPAIRRTTDAGRALHHAWVDRVFAPWIAAARGARRMRLRASLIAATDVQVWRVLRRDLALDVANAERSLRELVGALLD